MATGIVQMAVMKTLSLAKTSVFIQPLFSSTAATTAVAFTIQWLAVRRTNRCVRTAVIWNSLYVRASVILISHTERIRIVGLAPVAPRSVFPTHLDVIGYLIVMTQAMKIIVRWSLRSICFIHF